MSYGTCARAYKKIVCLDCGNTDELSIIQQDIFRVYVGKKNRYLCSKCFWKREKNKIADASLQA